MLSLLIAIFTQGLTFIPLALGISVSYHLLRATDMTQDSSFVLGAAVFAKIVVAGYSPLLAGCASLIAGAFAGMLTALIQRGGRVDPLLAGILATFILTGFNLVFMGRPNISLLSVHTLVSDYFNQSNLEGWIAVSVYISGLCAISLLLLSSPFGLLLRALGDNPKHLTRLGYSTETLRLAGFAFTNMLAAGAGCLTAQVVGYADIGMGIGMTLTGVGAVILGQQLIQGLRCHQALPRLSMEFAACLCGVILYFTILNGLLRMNVDPVYLKIVLGFLLIIFLRTALRPTVFGGAS